MRSSLVLLLVFGRLVLFAGCGDNRGARATPDARVNADAKVTADAKVFLDAPPNVGDGIAEAKAAADGTVSLAISGVTVTYVKPLVVGASATNDPAGFTIQSAKTGPALFVAVDPSTLTPALVKGDVVDFTITTLATVGGQKRATAISGVTRTAQGADVTALATDVTTATDLVTALSSYDSKVLSFTGTFDDDVGTSGAMFSKFTLDTTGITGNTALQFRIPTTLVTTQTMTVACVVAATAVPMGRFNAIAEIQAFSASDFTLTCKPVARKAVAGSATSLAVTFSRTIDPTSITADASQFHVTGLTLSAPVVLGMTVTLTTTAQTAQAPYTLTVDPGIKDAQMNVSTATATTTFTGYAAPASVRINELNANITGGCDLVELRVTNAGQLGSFKLDERDATVYTFPADFLVAKNDFVLVHFNSASVTCNPGGATTETAINGQLAATYAGNVDTAYDYWIADTGITSTDNVITLLDPTGAIADVVFLDDATPSEGMATATAASAAGAANAWLPAQATYTSAEFSNAAVKNLGGTGTAQAGTSIQRVNDVDTNAAVDWTTGAGVASTWGALNAGQAVIP